MQRKVFAWLLAISLLKVLAVPAAAAREASFAPNPQTPYAESFVAACEGQQWFIDEVERQLTAEQKTLDSVTGSADFANIHTLGFEGEGIEGHIPAAIGELTELRCLFLGSNRLSGELPAALFALQHLENVDLSGNLYSGAIPAGFGGMPALKVLNLKDNGYTGNIPTAILNSTTIEVLNLMSNKLMGAIPDAISGMTALTYLNLSQNDLGGEIPDFSHNKNLTALSLWNCNLSGDIPDSIYALTNLQILDLSGNALEGEISADIANLSALQYLALDNNQLRGVLPDAFAGTDISEIHIENNFLRGVLPESLAEKQEAKIYADNNYMTGEAMKAAEGNVSNFTDGASTAQYKLAATKTRLQISETGEINLYALLENRGNPQKPLLLPDEYTVTADGTKVEMTQDGSGFYVRALGEIPAAENLTVTICIKDNDGSDCSTAKIVVTTEKLSTPSGGSAALPEPYHKQYINGYSDGSFRPEYNITREEAAKLLVDAMEKKKSDPEERSYPDVSWDRWSYQWIEAATREGYVQGHNDGCFRPDDFITRGEMATILVRISAKEGAALGSSDIEFSDVEENQWYAGYIDKAVRYGLINGYSDGTFRPEQHITRAEAVVMTNRLLSRNYKTASELRDAACPFSDVTEGYWAYGEIMEAAISHNH